jgi:hypothetical protein
MRLLKGLLCPEVNGDLILEFLIAHAEYMKFESIIHSQARVRSPRCFNQASRLNERLYLRSSFIMSFTNSFSAQSGFAHNPTDLTNTADVLGTKSLLEATKSIGVDIDQSSVLGFVNLSVRTKKQTGKKLIVTGRRRRVSGTWGDDILDARRGKGNNILNGGRGNDKLFAKWKDVLSGGTGNDVLDASKGRGKNILKGDSGNDILLAQRNDQLFGGTGDDALWAKDSRSRLTGGAGRDKFWVNSSSNVRVTDFQASTDVIGIVDASGVGRFEDLILTQQGANTVVTLQGKTVATLVKVSSQALDKDSFNFVQSEGEALELTFNKDLNGNGTIGNPTQPVQNNGNGNSSQNNNGSDGATEKFDLSLDYGTYERLIKEVRGNLNLGSEHDSDENGSKDYKVDAVFNDTDNGFYAIGFISISGNKPPILVIRGSELGQPSRDALLDLLEDANPKGIGFSQFSANKDKVEVWLKDISRNAIKNPSLSLPVLTGESLGGAIAQAIASSYTQADGKLSQVITFNAPGIADDLVSTFKPANVGKVNHVVAYGDIVSLVGQEYLPGEYWLLDWNTPDENVALILPYMLDKHNQEDDNLIGNSDTSLKTQLNANDLSSSLFSYWNQTGISGNARRDWALLNLELGILSRGALPGMLANRGIAEFSRANLGVLLREALENRSDSLMANTILSAGHAIDALGDALVDSISHWNNEFWTSVAKWSPQLWTAIELSGLPAISFLNVGGVAAAEALASGGLLAATSLIAGGAEAFEALAGGGFKALQALASGDGQLAWDALSKGGKAAWQALSNRGSQGWDELIQGGETAWQALKTSSQDAWNSLLNGGERAWSAIASGIASKTFAINGIEYFQKLTSIGTVFEQIETLPFGKQISTAFQNGTSYLRNTFINGVNTFREEWLSGGKKIETAFQNGTSYLRDTFINGVNTFREEWLSGGKKIETAFQNGTSYLRNTFINGVNTFREEWRSGGKYVQNYFSQGKNTLRQTFQNGKEILRQVWEPNRYIEDAWDSTGQYLGQNVWDSAGNFISGVGNTISSWVDTVKSWF